MIAEVIAAYNQIALAPGEHAHKTKSLEPWRALNYELQIHFNVVYTKSWSQWILHAWVKFCMQDAH